MTLRAWRSAPAKVERHDGPSGGRRRWNGHGARQATALRRSGARRRAGIVRAHLGVKGSTAPVASRSWTRTTREATPFLFFGSKGTNAKSSTIRWSRPIIGRVQSCQENTSSGPKSSCALDLRSKIRRNPSDREEVRAGSKQVGLFFTVSRYGRAAQDGQSASTAPFRANSVDVLHKDAEDDRMLIAPTRGVACALIVTASPGDRTVSDFLIVRADLVRIVECGVT